MELGFGKAPIKRTIYCNRKYNDCLWYFWHGATKEHIPIREEALTCFITGIEITNREFKSREYEKLRIHVMADIPYVLECGMDTQFGQSALLALGRLTEEELRGRITFMPQAGEDDNVVFCRIYAGGEFVFIGEETGDVHEIAQRLIAFFGSPEEPSEPAQAKKRIDRPSSPSRRKEPQEELPSNVDLEEFSTLFRQVTKNCQFGKHSLQRFFEENGYQCGPLESAKDVDRAIRMVHPEDYLHLIQKASSPIVAARCRLFIDPIDAEEKADRALLRKMHAIGVKAWGKEEWDNVRHKAVHHITYGRTSSSEELCQKEAQAIVWAIELAQKLAQQTQAQTA